MSREDANAARGATLRHVGSVLLARGSTNGSRIDGALASLWRYRIGADRLGDHLFVAVRVKSYFADDQTTSDLEQLAHADDGPVRRRLAQEIDGQAGRDGQGHDADRGEYRDVERDVRNGHQQRPRDGLSGAQLILS